MRETNLSVLLNKLVVEGGLTINVTPLSKIEVNENSIRVVTCVGNYILEDDNCLEFIINSIKTNIDTLSAEYKLPIGVHVEDGEVIVFYDKVGYPVYRLGLYKVYDECYTKETCICELYTMYKAIFSILEGSI